MKLFRKPKSKFYWYDFTVRGRRYRGSTQETKSVRARHAILTLDVTRNDLVFLTRDRQLPGQAHKRLRIR